MRLPSWSDKKRAGLQGKWSVRSIATKSTSAYPRRRSSKDHPDAHRMEGMTDQVFWWSGDSTAETVLCLSLSDHTAACSGPLSAFTSLLSSPTSSTVLGGNPYLTVTQAETPFRRNVGGRISPFMISLMREVGGMMSQHLRHS